MERKFIISNGDKSIDIYNDRYIMMGDTQGVSVEADVNITQYGSAAGGVYNGCHVPSRAISVIAKFKRIGDMSAQKRRIYSIFQTDRELDIRYVTPSYDVKTKGYCTKCDIPPNVYPLVMSAEIICPDPYFKDAFVEPAQLFGVSPTFYFLSGGITLNKIVFGNTHRIDLVTIDYGGDTPTGGIFKISLFADCTKFRIDNLTVGKHIAFAGEFKAGDVIEISTEDNHKYANLTRDGVTVNALKYLTAESKIWQLSFGKNILKFTADELTDAGANVFFYYDVKVGGV